VSRLGAARVRMPARARTGDVVEVRALVEHPMESGYRLDNVGKPIPRHIVERFTVSYDGREVFSARLHPAVSTNPYFAFYLRATRSGEVVFAWADDEGGVVTHTARLEVEG
jgi:sulfur-oxidizing protein SoxZ